MYFASTFDYRIRKIVVLKELRRAGLLDVAEAESAIVELRLYGRA